MIRIGAMALLNLLNKSKPRPPKYPDAVLPLRQEDVAQVASANRNRVNPGSIAAALQGMPGLSQWHPASGEFVTVGPWRHRADIPTLQTVVASNHEDALIEAAIAAAQAAGKRGFVSMERTRRSDSGQAGSAGMALLESIVGYHHDRVRDFLDLALAPKQQFHHVTTDDTELMAGLIALDHRAFGWLWLNSQEEFLWWMHQPNVEVTIGMIGDQITSYFGWTLFNHFGHLDRIAVHPDYQGQGLGKESLHMAMQRAARLGVPRVALSTQKSNLTSRTMYERAGFRYMPEDDYTIYGVDFRDAREQSTYE